MPTEAENVQYLYLVLTSDGPPTIDWDAVGTALELKKGAVTKRWSRLKQSMEKGESPGGSTYQFLWLCVKHSTRDKAMNWTDIAAKCNTTAGAASKRYSRMKQAFEQDATLPGSSPAKPKTTPTPTPKKPKATASAGDDVNATPTPKRKRASPKKKTLATDEQKFKLEPEDGNDFSEEDKKPKRTKATKAKATPKPKQNAKAEAAAAAMLRDYDPPTPTTEATTFIKGEYDAEAEVEADDTFFDAPEHINDLLDPEGEHHTSRVQDWVFSSA
ncbi:Nn.00g116490.m01.CDS01 [Neocucurbitaria sp. VM-36]